MKKFFLSLAMISLFLAGPVMVSAYLDGEQTMPPNTSATPKLTNPLGDDIKTPQALIGQIINSVLGIVGSLALLMFVFGGITWMTSSGNQEKVKKGRDIIVWAAIGLVIVFSAYGLTRVLIEGVTK